MKNKIGIRYTEYPDFDWVIDQLVMLADEINKINNVMNNADELKKRTQKLKRLAEKTGE